MRKRNSRKRNKKQQKSFVIQKFTKPPEVKQDHTQETFKVLNAAILDIQTKEPGSATLEELYKGCSDLCDNNKSAELYENLKKLTQKYAKKQVSSLTRQTSEPKKFLELVEKLWTEFQEVQRLIVNVFTVLDRGYVLNQTTYKSIWKLCLNLFRRELNETPEVQRKIFQFIIELVTRERNGQQISRDLVKNVCRMIVAIEMYDVFEQQYIGTSQTYYCDEAKTGVNTSTIPDYLRRVCGRISEETDRCSSMLHFQTAKPLIQLMLKENVENHVEHILNTGFVNLLETKDLKSLGRLYNLLLQIDKIDMMKSHLLEWMKTANPNFFEITKDYVPKLIKFKKFLDELQNVSFEKTTQFSDTYRKGWIHIMNVVPVKASATIADHVDRRLRQGAGGSQEDFNQEMNNIMLLLSYINGSDIFRAFYQKFLAKRLLLKKVSSDALERDMIDRIECMCGRQFSQRLHDMFQDIEISADVMKKYRNERKIDTVEQIEWDTKVLTASTWPHNKEDFTLDIPENVQKQMDEFEKWYKEFKKGRSLQWLYNFSHCVIKGNFPKGMRELVLSVYQGTIILCFNEKSTYVYEELLAKTKLPEDIFKSTLDSLLRPLKLMEKSGSGSPKKGDKFRVNKHFQHPNYRVKLNYIQIKDTEVEKKKTTDAVFKDRKTHIQAAIVRIMKARKELKHNDLINQTFELLSFPCEVSQIKSQVSILIQKDYIERDPDDSAIYLYKA